MAQLTQIQKKLLLYRQRILLANPGMAGKHACLLILEAAQAYRPDYGSFHNFLAVTLQQKGYNI